MSSNQEFADFTSYSSNPVVCQRCLQSFADGTDLYFMQDTKADGSGKRVCAGCRQYYLKKTESRQLDSRLCQFNFNGVQSRSNTSYSGRAGRASTTEHVSQITPNTQEAVSRQSVHKAVAEAQRNGIISHI
jgi:hypothetical protein